MKRLRVKEVVVVEGRYDAAALEQVIDGLVITTGGFGIFSDEEQKMLIKKLGRERGLIIFTDSDAAGFRIRNYIEKIAAGCSIKHAYIPTVEGKERRKSAHSKEGILGVEGMDFATLRKALEDAGITEGNEPAGRQISFTDIYEMGISGGPNSAEFRRRVLAEMGLPVRLSKRAMIKVISSLFSYEELKKACDAVRGEFNHGE